RLRLPRHVRRQPNSPRRQVRPAPRRRDGTAAVAPRSSRRPRDVSVAGAGTGTHGPTQRRAGTGRLAAAAGSTGAVSPDHTYASPAAFRRALTDKLKTVAGTSRWTLQQLQRQMAYDRLLERLYLVDDGWIVKGATALLARDLGVRSTIDIDVYRDAARQVAEADLRTAASADIGDWFRFDVRPAQPTADRTAGAPFPGRGLCRHTRGGRVPGRPGRTGSADDGRSGDVPATRPSRHARH